MGPRFQKIADDLFKLDAFKNLTVVKRDTFHKRYTELKRYVTQRWANIDQEGANLSGLPEFNSNNLKRWEKKM